MKKLLLFVFTFLLSLAACVSIKVTVTPSVPALPASAPLAAASPLPSALPSPYVFALDTDIPDVVLDPGEISICSSNPLQEDDDYYYFSPTFSYSEGVPYKCIYCISKSDGSKKRITDRFGAFTVAGGVVYYSNPDNNTVYCYDTASGEEREIKSFKYYIRYLSYSGGRFYYLLDDSGGPINFCGLYSCNTDWSDTKVIAEAVSAEMFFIYKNKIYYEISPDNSSAYISACSSDGSAARQVSDIFHLWYEFAVKNGKLFYHDRSATDYQDWTFNIQDIDTGSLTQLEDCDSFSLLGQYVVYPDYDDYFLYAYDITGGKQYKLLRINEGYISNMYTTPCGAYISLVNGDNYFSLYKISISGGKASLEKAAEVPGGTDQ